MNRYGFKILYDGNNYYLCLLKIPKESKVVANDCKYRTNRAYVCDIRNIRSCKSKYKVIHQCFYDNYLITYQIDTYVESELDISQNICAPGIHYFPLTTMIDYVNNYFKNLFIDWKNVSIILFLWNIKIIYRKSIMTKSTMTNLINAFIGKYDQQTFSISEKEVMIMYNFIKKDL
jgi:hypothetical protein